ncbi:hypothetical protein OS187_04185 [Xanthomonadaceae bacterium JHOS43]|nr:hypothetical protein [Xanthomonadaceae bacterium JHOS43]
MPRRASTVLSLLALCSALACPPADAAVMLLRVGAGAQCDYRTDVLPNALQSAIDAVPTSIPAGDAYVIRVARSGNYSGVKLDLFNRGVIIEGGYATCSSATSDSTNTEIDAAGAAAGPALDIHGGSVRRNIVVRRLTVKNSDGGGLLVRSADVRLERVTVTNNNAGNGGGIALIGGGQHAIVRLDGNSAVTDNTASLDGGGIHCSSGGELYLASASSVVTNTAGLHGGGIMLDGCSAQINSGATGLAGLFVNIGFNDAEMGGGIAVRSSGGGPGSSLTIGEALGSSDPRPLILNNEAGNQGGGIFASGPQTQVRIHDATVSNNTAASIGGGIMVRDGAVVEILRTRRRCGGAEECSLIVDNQADWGGGISVVGDNAQVRVEGTRVEDNHATAGGSAYFAMHRGAVLMSENNVIVGNTGASTVEISPGAGAAPRVAEVHLLADTIADNAGGAAVINANAEGRVVIARTIVNASTSLPVLQRTGSGPQVQWSCNVLHVQTNVSDHDEQTSFTTAPGFINAASGNYRLLVDAWAIDRCPSASGFRLFDHNINPRPVDSPHGNVAGPYDVGAYEWNSTLFEDGFED